MREALYLLACGFKRPAFSTDTRSTVVTPSGDCHQDVVLRPGALRKGILEVGDADLELIRARAEGCAVVNDRPVVHLAEPDEIIAVARV